MSTIEANTQAAVQAIANGQPLAEHLGFSTDLLKVLYSEAVGHYDHGQTAEAIAALDLLTKLDMRRVDYWALLGNCLNREGKFQEALACWQMAMTIKPDRQSAMLVARTALALKDPAAAAEALLAARPFIVTQEHVEQAQAVIESLNTLVPA